MASKYKNVYNQPASSDNLAHIFDILNEKNEDRIVFRDFCRHIEYYGLTKLDQKAQRKIYDHIASAVKKNRYITKESWVKGVNIAHKQPNTHKLYTYVLGGHQYDPQPGREEIDLEEIRVKLLDTKAPWMYRIECMESLCRQITNQKSVTKDKFHAMFRNYHISLTKQAKDRRSNVSRVACECISKIILFWKNEFLKYSYTIIEYIFELVRQKIKVVHESGYNVLTVLLKNCGDHKEFKMLDILGKEGTTSKFVNLQKDCFDLLLLYLTQQSPKLKSKNEFWTKLLEYTQTGVNDTAEVRNSALKLLAQIQFEKPQIVGKIVGKMNVHLKKRYESEYLVQGNGNPNANNTFGDDEKDFQLPQIKTKSSKNSKKDKTPKSPMSPKSPKSKKPKSSASFPKPPKGKFLNGFGELLTENDIDFAFDFIDIKNSRKLTLTEFELCCQRLNVSGNPESLFNILGGYSNGFGDEQKAQPITLDKFRACVHERNAKLMDFWTKLLSGKHLETSAMSGDLEFDESNKLLLNNKNSENERLKAMYSVTRKICNLKKFDNNDKFEKQYKKCLGPLLNQLKDRSNSVVREVCVCLSKIFMARGTQYRSFTIRTLENLCEVIKLQGLKVHTSAKQSVAAMIKYIPDRSACPMMKVISENCCAKNFKLLRSASFEYVNYYLFVMLKEFEEKKKVFWDFLEKAMASGLNDSDPGVRDLAYIALVKVEMLKKDVANKYVPSLKKARKEKYDSLKKDELRRIQKGEMYSVDTNHAKEANTHSSNEAKSKKKTAKKKSDKDKDKSYKINKRPKDDMSDDESERKMAAKLRKDRAEKDRLDKAKREKNERMKREKEGKEREKERLQKEILKKEKEIEKREKARAEKESLQKEKAEKERVQTQKLEKERQRKQKLQKEKADKERLEQEKIAKQKSDTQKQAQSQSDADGERRERIRQMKEEERRDRLERQRKEKEKSEMEAKEEESTAEEERAQKERLQKRKAEKERLRAEKLEKQTKETQEKVRKLKEEQRQENHGFPKVHIAYERYFEDKGVKCTNPTHLVLFAKQKGLNGVAFGKVNKYLKAIST